MPQELAPLRIQVETSPEFRKIMRETSLALRGLVRRIAALEKARERDRKALEALKVRVKL